MGTEMRPLPGNAGDDDSASIATPEGDNEMAPDQPLEPAADRATAGLEDPRGAEPDAYKRDHD